MCAAVNRIGILTQQDVKSDIILVNELIRSQEFRFQQVLAKSRKPMATEPNTDPYPNLK